MIPGNAVSALNLRLCDMDHLHLSPVNPEYFEMLLFGSSPGPHCAAHAVIVDSVAKVLPELSGLQ